MKLLQIGAIALAAAVALGACSSKGKATGEGGWAPGGAGVGGPEIGKFGDGYGGGAYGSGGRYGSIGPQGDGTKGARGKYGGANPNDPNGPLGKKVIYFQYDSSEVLPEYLPVINNHANYLASDKAKSVVLEGHADERGSPEYNIALGEQRAKSVAQLMKLQGVTEAQIQIVSFGEEKPQVFTHDDDAWQKNRRVVISYPGN